MKLYTTLIFLLIGTAVFAQNSDENKKRFPFVNITEIGVSLGRTPIQEYYYYYPSYSSFYYPGPYPSNSRNKNVANWTISSFNGLKLTKKTSVGLTLGLDNYTQGLVMPLSLGLRQTLIQKGNEGASIFASLDAGYGFSLQKAEEYMSHKGGLMANPAVGIRLPMKNEAAFIFSAGYKRQGLSIESDYPENYNLYSLENQNFNRMVLRMGFEF